jgi:hypothetical protein
MVYTEYSFGLSYYVPFAKGDMPPFYSDILCCKLKIRSSVYIIVDKTALSEQYPFLEHLSSFDPVLDCLDFAKIFFFLQSKVVSLASNPQPGGPGPCIYVPQ